MALPSLALGTLLLALFLAHVDPSMSEMVKGSVSCLDCTPHHDFSGVRVGVECSHERKLATTLTNNNGYFEVKISPPSATSLDCFALLLGGPEQLCSYKKTMVSKITKARGSDAYSLTTPLAFLTSCPTKSSENPAVRSSKTINFPLPREWGIAPSSYYVYPYMPIIGIP